MKKNILTLIFMALCSISFGQQDPAIKKDLPNIIPPSPTVAGLMKFEEVPVSNYTGVPSITIPLFTSPTISKDISIPCNLQYHTGSIAADEVAGDVGLGWSITATGAVSRTVRGLPDEILDKWTKIGIYYDNESNNSNHYYDAEKYLKGTLGYGDYYDEFLFDSEKGKYDSEHDLYQFNFLGNSGRFLIKKVSGLNQLEVVRLDQGTAKVILNYTHDSTNGFSINGFTIYDDKGYKYVFENVEYTTQSGISQSIYFDNEESLAPLPTYQYKSAFHLSNVYNQNNILLITFNYEISNEIISSKSSTIMDCDVDFMNNPYYLFNYVMQPHLQFNYSQLGPRYSYTNNSRTIASHKVSAILVNGISKLNFEYETGRSDSDIHNGTQAKKLKRIYFKDWNENLIESFEFGYTYREHTFATGNLKRMFLDEIKRVSNQNRTEKHRLFYKDNPTDGKYVSKDYWGYMNLKPSNLPFLKTTEPNFCTTDVLEKIEYPTGGVRVFDFESNTYSFIGNEPVTRFDENPNNWTETSQEFTITSNGQIQCMGISPSLSVIPLGEEYEITIEVTYNNFDGNLITLKKGGVAIGGIGCNSPIDSCRRTLMVNGGDMLELCYNFLNGIGQHTIGGTIKYKRRKQNPDQYLFGGGIRIKRILNFDNLNEIENQADPLTKITYDYSYEENLNKSSGSLVFPKPKFEHTKIRNHAVRNMIASTVEQYYELLETNNFTYNTSLNNLGAVKTSGSDVGYKNIKIFNGNNNGFSTYTYTSPLDYPEIVDVYNTDYPFLPVKNFDYKRGLLIEEKKFDNEKVLKKTTNEYSFTNESLISYGVRLFSTNECPYLFKYSNYNSYKSFLDHCTNVNLCIYPIPYVEYQYNDIYTVCGNVSSFTQSAIVEEAIGWAKLIKTTSYDYLYENNSPRILDIVQEYTYNPVNKKISELTVTNSTNGINKTKFYYHNGNSIHSDNRIAEIQKIEKFKDGQLLETANINYANSFAGNVSYLPANITVSKGQLSLEQDVVYLSYDENSNPLCVSKANGTMISYIWGYNKTQPVAKLENIAYANIPSTLITNIQSLTSSATATEAQIIAALNALRTSTDVNMQKAMITTLTYKPLVGITSVTDPKGDIITYVYDDFNRLKEVRDKNNNLLSENEYHYRTQN
jgi:YD repeat-containing protein